MQSPEGLHKSGENFVLATKRYLEATLVIDVLWTVYDGNGMTVLRGLDGQPHTFDALARLKEGEKRPIYIEAKKRTSANINAEYDDFIAKSFSCYMAERWRPDWNPYFMFVTDHPFKMKDYARLLDADYLLTFLGTFEKYGIDNAALEHVVDFKDRVWLVIWSNRQELMCVTNPALYQKLVVDGGG